MVNLNIPYSIENGNDKVIFREGKKGSITGTYNDGTLKGMLENNVLKAAFHNTKINVSGLMEIIFHENVNKIVILWSNSYHLPSMIGGCQKIL